MSDQTHFQRARLSRDARFDGQFFVAVKTTGIFCRPICPANAPKEQNVEYFALAQLAMHAGYRPCLRCRPDSAPDSFAWKGIDTTVERAIRLLKQYPQLAMSSIADKLGISERYLRSLFQQKLGISPKQFQLYEQLLFAKSLLHQSTLPIEQVAQAAGFQSARRLQANMQKRLLLSPSQIRQSTAQPNQYLCLPLNFRPPYNWPQVRDFLAVRAIPNVEEVGENYYQRRFLFEGSRGQFRATYNAAAQRFDVDLKIDNISLLKALLQNIRRVLDVDADSPAIEQQLICCGFRVEQLVTGIRIPGVWSSFEAGIRAILGQQVSVKAAMNQLGKLVSKLADEGHFVTPQQVAASELAFLGMPQSRRDTLRRFAQYYCDHPQQSDVDAWQQLKGIGPWTVAYAKMRGQSQPDVWLNSDLVVKKQLAQLAQDAQTLIDPQQARPWRSYLTLQLWSMA